MTGSNTEAAILTLLAERGAGKTICPSEAARLLARERRAPEEWRKEMAAVHAAARRLAAEGRAVLMQGGEVVAEPVGAYRIGRGAG